MKTVWPKGYKICANSGKQEFGIWDHPSLLSEPEFIMF